MKINKLIFLILPLIFITGYPEARSNPKASTLRPLSDTPVKVLMDLWQIRTGIDATTGHGLTYYNVPGGLTLAEQPTDILLRNNSKDFYHGIERMMGYSANSFWKYYRFINADVPERIDVTIFEVANTVKGRDFVTKLQACGYNDIAIGKIFVTSIFDNELITHPHSTCIKNAFNKSYHNDYIAAGGDGDHDLNRPIKAESPFILRAKTISGRINPIMTLPMSPRTSQEIEYIAYLKTKVIKRFEKLLGGSFFGPFGTMNPACFDLLLVEPPKGRVYTTCTKPDVTGKIINLNFLLDNDYISHGGGSVGGHTENFSAKYPHEKGLINAVFDAIASSNETDFINATAKLAASHPDSFQRSRVLNAFPDLFATKDFQSFSDFYDYMHVLLNSRDFSKTPTRRVQGVPILTFAPVPHVFDRKPISERFIEENRAHALRPWPYSIAHMTSAIWTVRKNLDKRHIGTGLHFYNRRATRPNGLHGTEIPRHSWLEENISDAPGHIGKDFYNGIERIFGFPTDFIWKYRFFINETALPRGGLINSTKFEILNNVNGKNFVTDLNSCGYRGLNIRDEFESSQFVNTLSAFSPTLKCLEAAYQTAWTRYYNVSSEDNDTDVAVDKNYPDDPHTGPSPFILKRGYFLVPSLVGDKPMSVKSVDEGDYINYLHNKIVEKYEQYMEHHTAINPYCNDPNMIVRVPGGNFTPKYADCRAPVAANRPLAESISQYLDSDYITHGKLMHEFTSIGNYERKLWDEVFATIENSDEERFINVSAKLTASFPMTSHRNTLLENLPTLYVTKDFANYLSLQAYWHYLPNCTRFY